MWSTIIIVVNHQPAYCSFICPEYLKVPALPDRMSRNRTCLSSRARLRRARQGTDCIFIRVLCYTPKGSAPTSDNFSLSHPAVSKEEYSTSIGEAVPFLRNIISPPSLYGSETTVNRISLSSLTCFIGIFPNDCPVTVSSSFSVCSCVV